ncbi:serine protease inhibitor [Desulfitispora alkaliphila]|uniref:serpin family protein n=1 Tax=Desulfitispora alkaliphila TaxID=622674 RepID=UPI003D20F36A
MKKSITIVFISMLLIIGMTFLTGCENDTTTGGMNIPKPENEVLDVFDPSISNASNDFGIKVLQNLVTEDENIFISPTSIYTALAMTYNGSGSETKEAMAEVLGIEDLELDKFNKNNLALLYYLQVADPSVTINIANSLWMKENIDFADDFVERNETFYRAQKQCGLLQHGVLG